MQQGVVGIPNPGVTIKLVPNAGKLEARVKSPSVTPGYWREPALTEAAFDEEGYYRFGDALRFADESDPERGFVFDGRITEDFKLRRAPGSASGRSGSNSSPIARLM